MNIIPETNVLDFGDFCNMSKKFSWKQGFWENKGE